MGKGFSAEVRFSFPAVLSLLLCTDREGTALLCLLCCILHELGHIAAMLIERKPPRKITFYGGGILLSSDWISSIPVLLGGCAVNFVLSAVFLLWGIFPMFGALNLLTGLLNLLPMRPLDGGMLLERAYLRFFPPERVVRLMAVTEAAAGALLVPVVAVLFYKGAVGISAVIFLIYLLAVEIFEKL